MIKFQLFELNYNKFEIFQFEVMNYLFKKN
jgi:hypothetical protein